MNPDIITYGAAGLAFIAITAVGFVFAGSGRGKQSKRMKTISDGGRTGRGGADVNAVRRKQMADATKALRDREAANRRSNAVLCPAHGFPDACRNQSGVIGQCDLTFR